MPRKLTLTVLGGGSYFTPSFIGTMVQKPELWTDATVRLHDPFAPERVEWVRGFCERYTARKGVPMTFQPEPDLDRALDGADFVIATFRIGGIRALALDEAIPPRFGYYGDETAGPGGLFMAIRTAPVVLDAARRMERLCPEAWLLNYANPTHFVTAAVAAASRTKVIGLCDNFICPMADLSWLLGMDSMMRRIRARQVGYNHCNWTYAAELDGRDLLRELRDADPDLIETNLRRSERAREGFERMLMLFRLTGWLPVGISHFMPYFFHADYAARQSREGARPHTHVGARAKEQWDQLRSQLTDYDDAVADRVARAQHGGAHADLALGVASAIAADAGVEYAVNVPHGDAVAGFPPDTVIELCARIGKNGATPVRPPPFPPMILGHQQLLFAYLRLVVEGILEKNKEKFLQALFIHPFTSSLTKAKELFTAMWEEEREVHGTYWDGV